MRYLKNTGCRLANFVIYFIMTGALVQAAPTDEGSVVGTVTYNGKAPAPRLLKVDKDMNVCGNHPKYSEELMVAKTGGLKNVVIQIVGAKGEITIPKAADRPTIAQKGCQFIPHVLVVPVGTKMNILNEDGILHNIHTFSVDNRPVNKAQPKFKKKLEFAFKVPEIIPVKCDIHGWMKAWIVVVDHPYYALTDEKGSFKISGILPGTYSVEFWHETLGKQTRKITVTAGTDSKVDAVFQPKK